MMHTYAFGSICRGEIERDSDIDLLALVDGHDERFDPGRYSIYSYQKIKLLWSRGSPFAWHLALESRLLFASDGKNFLEGLGKPEKYSHCLQDCEKFANVFFEARTSLQENKKSAVFDLSTVFLSIRNFATCFSLGLLDYPNFSRHAAKRLTGAFRLQISDFSYRILERSRILCTRGYGDDVSVEELVHAMSEFDAVAEWMNSLLKEVRNHGRV